MDLLTVKIIVLALSGVIRLLFGLFPLILMKTLTRKFSSVKDNKRIKYVISVLMFFGGGVLLATCFLHMMPEVRESMSHVNLNTSLPVPELIFIAGFFLVYILEDLIHGVIHRRRLQKNKTKSGLSNTTKNNLPFTEQYSLENGFSDVSPNPKRTLKVSRKSDGTNYNDLRAANEIFGRHVSPHEMCGIIPRVRSESGKINTLSNGSQHDPRFSYVDSDWWRDTVVANNSQMNLVSGSMLSIPAMHEIPLNGGNSPMIAMTPNREPGSKSWSSLNMDKEHDHHGGHGHSHMTFPIDGEADDTSVASAIRNLLIVIAISFHGIFEGLAIGLQGTEKSVWALFLAVSLHECTILFCIGVELISAQTKVIRMITYIIVVSLVCPLGIGLGIIISENSMGNTMVHALLVGSLQASFISLSSYYIIIHIHIVISV